MERTQRAHIVIPVDLLREIDAIVGPRGRSAFLLETAREEVRRRKLLAFLDSHEPAWRDEDHPELRGGSAKWIQKLRAESDRRLLPAFVKDSKPGKCKQRKSRKDLRGNRALASG